VPSQASHHIALDGKTLRGSKDEDGDAEHCLSTFAHAVQKVLGHTASRGKGMETPDALALLERIDLTDKVVTGDAMFCQKKHNRKDRGTRRRLRLAGQRQPEKTSRRYPNGVRNAGFPPSHAGRRMNKGPWPNRATHHRGVACRNARAPSGVAEYRVNRQSRAATRVKRKGQWVNENETAWLITSLTAPRHRPKPC
jgi:predicted transposase YbfD/YdcC